MEQEFPKVLFEERQYFHFLLCVNTYVKVISNRYHLSSVVSTGGNVNNDLPLVEIGRLQ